MVYVDIAYNKVCGIAGECAARLADAPRCKEIHSGGGGSGAGSVSGASAGDMCSCV